MQNRSTSIIVLIAIELMLLFALASIQDGSNWRSSVFNGVLAAQFSLVGVWLGVGDGPLLQRSVLGGAFILVLLGVAITRPNFNPWELMLAGIRVVALGTVFGLVRCKRQLVVRRSQRATEVQLVQLSLSQLFLLTCACAVFLALSRLLENYAGDLYQILLVAIVVLLGLAASLVSLVAAAVVLSNSNGHTIFVSIFAIVCVATALAWFTYVQSSATIAAQWFAMHILEAMLVAVSLVAARLSGYQLIRDSRIDGPRDG